MSENDPNTAQVIFKDILGNGESSAITNRINEIILKKVNMHILEMEDVLFHLNSAVMMPENPQGKSSDQGGGAADEQVKVSGIKALGLVFKQFEFDQEVKMVISGHTDTSGTDEFNFKLSKERAENILYLLYKDEKDESKKKWAEICFNRQKIEDYQQILTHFEKKLACGCDPKGIDDKWGDNTKKATENFMAKMGFGSVKIKSMLYELNLDPNHKWPKELWESVYTLYSRELADTLEITEAELEGRRKTAVKFIDDKKRIVACGESFPIDQKEKNNYRSQKNRRVELLFFDKDEAPELTCPALITKAHTEDECPLWRKFYFIPLYIDPKDLKSIVFHLKFVYFDKIKKKQIPVPAGLIIKAYEDGHKEIPSETVYKDGIYFLKVKFKDKIKDPARTRFYFEAEAENKYCYTRSEKSDPVIRSVKEEDFKKYSFEERLHYYDLPKFWSSRNYWTRYDGDMKKGERFEKVFKDTLKLKPLGDEITKKDKPLVFSFDDVVLVNSAKSQILQDKNQNDNPIPLDENSRFTLFHIDAETEEDINGKKKKMMRMKIHNPEADQPVFTDVKFKENIIPDTPLFSRVVYFANDFYDITDKRSHSSDISFDYSKKHIAGCRLAMCNDSEVHHFQDFFTNNASDKANAYGYNGTFHFELHYFHDCVLLDNKPLQYLFIYWNCRISKNSAKGGTDADVANHRKHGMTNAMERLNKDYMLEKSSGSKDYFIRPFHFMEAKNNTNGGKEKHDVTITDNNNGSWNAAATASYRAACYQSEPGGWGGGDPASDLILDSDGKAYVPLANHHEMGHATGCFDDYLYSLSINNDAGASKSTFVPRFAPQHIEGGPYSTDVIARMKSNRSSRLRNYWKYVVWLHDMSQPAKPLNKQLDGTRFKIRYPGKKNGTAFDHVFELADSYKNISLPAFKELNYELVTAEGTANEKKSKADMLLYKMADDQLSHFKNPGKQTDGYESSQIYYGILVVKIKIAAKFTGGFNFNAKKQWLQKVDEDAKPFLNAKFYLECNHNDFKKLYVYFVPHFQEYTAGPPADSNINVEVKWSAGTTVNRVNLSNISMDRGNNAQQNDQVKRLLRCITANSFAVGDTAGPAKNDFPKIVEWVKTKLGNVNVEMKDI